MTTEEELTSTLQKQSKEALKSLKDIPTIKELLEIINSIAPDDSKLSIKIYWDNFAQLFCGKEPITEIRLVVDIYIILTSVINNIKEQINR